MKGLSFWQWLGLIVIIAIIGNILYSLLYGNRIIAAQEKIITNSQQQA